MKLTRVQNMIKQRDPWRLMQTVCLLLLCAWACEWVQADGDRWTWALSPYVRHYPSAATLCLFMLSPHRFQLHGPQTRPLIPSCFLVKGCQLYISQRWAVNTDIFAQYIMSASIFAQCRAHRAVLLFHETQSSSKHEHDGVSLEVPNWKQHSLQDWCCSLSCWSHFSWLPCAESSLDVAQK